MPVQGVPAFDAIALLEIDGIGFAARGVELVAHGAFVNTKTGVTYGRTTCRQWSKRTLDLLQELRDAMETDMAALVFEPTGGAPSAPRGLAFQDPGGIGEHAGRDDAEPV